MLNVEDEDLEHVSPCAQALVKGLLELDTRNRLNAFSALRHPWLRASYTPAKESLLGAEVLLRLKDFQKQMAITHAVETYRSMHNSRAIDIQELRRMFSTYDSKMGGTVSYDETCDVLRQVLGEIFGDEAIESMLVQINLESSHKRIDYKEVSARRFATSFFLVSGELRGAAQEGRAQVGVEHRVAQECAR